MTKLECLQAQTDRRGPFWLSFIGQLAYLTICKLNEQVNLHYTKSESDKMRIFSDLIFISQT